MRGTEKLFVFRQKNNDRDRCGYIENKNFNNRFECDHFFGRIGICGANYYGSKFPNYGDIETVLTKKQYTDLVKIDEAFSELGYGIVMGDGRYEKGIKLCEKLEPILETLRSDKAKEFFANIVKEEKEELAEDYNLTEEEIEEIWENNPTEYEDKSIVTYIYDDAEDVARGLCDSCYDIPENLETYFDYKKFGEDLVSEGAEYYELADGRVVCYAY